MQALVKGQLPLVDGGKAVINTAYCENLVEGLVLAGTVPRAAGKTYVIADKGALELENALYRTCTPAWRSATPREPPGLAE